MNVYLIVIGKTATGYSAHCPDVPGCAAVGKTVEQVTSNMRRSLILHFEGMLEDGEPIPKPSGVKSYREAMKDLDVEHFFLAHVQIDANRLTAPANHQTRRRA
jgi:predicted RNase H-like HicB family nuclease